MVARQKANPNSPAWGLLEGRWENLKELAMQTLMEHQNGKPFVAHEIAAARQVLNLTAVPPSVVIRTCLATYLMADLEPRRFRSDRAFDFQLVRRVRSLAAINVGSYWDAKLQRVTRVYRDLSPRAMQALAVVLKGAFAAPGVQFSAVERELKSKEADAQRRLTIALQRLR